MKQLSSMIKKYAGENPFGDYQGRNFSDLKVCGEFYPISTFWSLFNEQHEIILGSRGSGKTFLLKMMRLSMLKNICDERANLLVSEKRFISLYIPMHLEFITSYTKSQLAQEQQINMFQVAFNCLLAQSMITELRALVQDYADIKERIKLTANIVKQINEIWFQDSNLVCYDWMELEHKVNKVFYSIDEKTGDISKAPTIFQKQICSPLLAVKDLVSYQLGFNDPTWIICVDEAEFLNEPLLKCINSVFRSDSNRIALKIATLPFYHCTFETLKTGTFVSEGNDFNYRIVDMAHDSEDFKQVTNRICLRRLSDSVQFSTDESVLESFLGKIGNDDLVDYFRYEMGEDITQEQIEDGIFSEFSSQKRAGAKGYVNKRKTVYDKYAPIYFLRKMRERSGKGNRKTGWYAGAKTVRKVAQGNPRMFIHLMNELFEKAKKTRLTPKAQHEVIYNYCRSICDATKAIEDKGPIISNGLNSVAEKLRTKTHGKFLVASSSSFLLKYTNDEEFAKNADWIKLAIAHSRLFVDEGVKKGLLTQETKYSLANVFAVVYWLPMRKDTPTTIVCSELLGDNKYIVSTAKKKKRMVRDQNQLTLFGEDEND